MNRTRCPLCGHRLKYPEDRAGHQARCPRCGFPFRLPAVGSSSGAEEGPESITGRDLTNLVALNNQLSTKGTEHLSHFLDRASPTSVARFSGWLTEASPEAIRRVAERLNEASPGQIDFYADWWEAGPGGPARVAACVRCHGPADTRDEFHFHGYKKRFKVGDKYRYDGIFSGSEHYCRRCIAAVRTRMLRGVVAGYLILGVVLLIVVLCAVLNRSPVFGAVAAVVALAAVMAVPTVRRRTDPSCIGQTLAVTHNRERLGKRGMEFVGPGRSPGP
jgi:hypothetical protein